MPSLLDLFCGAGGAARGYAEAGFSVTGVDHQRGLSFPYPLVVADVFAIGIPSSIDAVHASPPCQGYTNINHWNASHRQGTWKNETPKLLEETRAMLDASGKPWVIENVIGARKFMRNPILIHGGQFGMRVYRPRLFETNWDLKPPAKAPRPADVVSVYGEQNKRRLGLEPRKDGTYLHVASMADACVAMGIDWMTWKELTQAIPPAYTRWVGDQLMNQL